MNKERLTFPLIYVLCILSLTACASGRTSVDSNNILYETDFSSDDGMFTDHGRPLMKIDKGTLLLSGKDPGCNLIMPYGKDTETTFRLKFADLKGKMGIHLFWNPEGGTTLNYHFNMSDIHYNIQLNHEDIEHDENPLKIQAGIWYDIDVLIEGERALFKVNDKVFFDKVLPSELPESGYCFFIVHDTKCHVDDFRIVSIAAELPERELPDGEVLYESSFDQDDGMLEFHRGMAVEDGVLNFVEDKPGCNFRDPYGQDSITEFLLKLPTAESSTEINFLWDPEAGTTLLYHLMQSSVHCHMEIKGEEVFHQGYDYYMKAAEWHQIRVDIINGMSTLYIDGNLVMESLLDSGLPRDGYFFPITYNSQMQIDDLLILKLPEDRLGFADPEQTSSHQPLPEIGAVDLGERRIAVVGIKADDPEISDALASFVTNAMVNMNIGRIMERSDVEQIISEYEFQSNAITDESTAVEIGKLLGADVITVGSLYQVGTIDYLNIKIIDVKTGEIIASSMSSSTVEEEYLRMCNEAVEQIGR